MNIQTLFPVALVVFAACAKTPPDHPKTYKFEALSFPWSSIDTCKKGIALCAFSLAVDSTRETSVYCDMFFRLVEASEGAAAASRYQGLSYREMINSMATSTGFSRATKDRCLTMLFRIEERVSLSKLEAAWKMESKVACLDSCMEHELPHLSDCVPSVVLKREAFRDRRCLHRHTEDKPRSDNAFAYCRAGCGFNEETP
jgi:hypothetical protein